MTIQRYEVFNTVVALENITKAGASLNMTQSGVSHAIRSLEDEFGVKLLIRNKSGIQLTREGERVHAYTLKIINAHYSLLQEVHNMMGLETGIIRVGSFSSVTAQWMPEVLKYFSEVYPGISIQIYEDDYESLEHGVAIGELDCCFTTASTHKKIEFTPFKKDKLFCIVSRQNPLAEKEIMPLSEIEKHPLVKPKKGWDNEVADFFNHFNIKPDVKYEVSDDRSILALIQADMGINIRPELVMSGAPDDIVPLELEVDAYRIIGIGTSKWVSPATSLFVSVVTDMFQEELFK
ncbi:LysR family transcriptional regulator [Salinicoccus bachuensis]|uniref:LysR family transcriptional regulator n=1 Tax=Salinicoccus bachuensis TaxID=3136731 RepID=A0ABZ3CGS7_9STAP